MENTEEKESMGGSPSSMTWLIVVVVLLLGGVIFYPQIKSYLSPAAKPAEKMMTKGVTTEVKFANHIQMGFPEQDVYVVDPKNPKWVWRVEGDKDKKLDDATLAKVVYASSGPVKHDPFKVGKNPLGPFPIGASLGFTMAQWLAATGSGTYTVDGDQADLNLTFTNLVPNGTYTIWCSRLTLPPNVNVVDKPCGAADGSQNMFKTDAQGNGTFSLKMPTVEASTKETVSLLALAYHSDGKTYGAAPGDFGLNSHIQMAFIIPPPAAAMPSEGAK